MPDAPEPPTILPRTGGQRPRSPGRVLLAVIGGLLAGTAVFALIHFGLSPTIPVWLNVLVFGALVLVGVFMINNMLTTEGRNRDREPVD